MTFKQLEGLCAFADTLSFTKAAEKIYISQSALSREIASLENELGCQLIDRNRKEPRLTSAGERIVNSARHIMKEQRSIEQAASMARAGTIGGLRVGFITAGMTNVIIKLFQDFRRRYPANRLEFYEYSEADVYRAIENDRIDFGLVLHFPDEYREIFDSRVVDCYPLCLICSSDHPLANKKSVDFSELADEDFVIIDSKEVSEGYAYIINQTLENKFVPKVSFEADSTYNMLICVSCNLGISIGPASVRAQNIPGLSFVPITGGIVTEYRLVFKKVNKSQAVQQLLQMIDD